jgi:hypothetical protein
MSDYEKTLYPNMGQRADEEVDEHGEKVSPSEPRHLSNEEAAQIVYPKPSELYQQIDEDGRATEDIIRTRDGLVKHRARYHGDVLALAQFNGDALANCVLTDLDFHKELKGAEMPNADLRGSKFRVIRNSNLRGADARGTRFEALRNCDLREMVVDETTDITDCDLTGSKYDLDQIMRCKGWRTCRGLKTR